MMNKRYLLAILSLVLLLSCYLVYSFEGNKVTIDRYISIDRPAEITPDYSGMMIPPNIAPLNFLVQEDGTHYYVKIYSKQAQPITIASRTPKIIIPAKQWHRLLSANKGQELYFDIFVKTQGDQWNRFSVITNKIANENIDDFLVYRKIYPGHGWWRKMGIYQRNLQSYNEDVIIDNTSFGGGCVNCHAFASNNISDKMLLDIRGKKYGSSAIVVDNGVPSKLGQKLGFVAWHPSGKLFACSISMPTLLVNQTGNYTQDIFEIDSFLTYYLFDPGVMKTSAKFSTEDRLELYPEWSPDGQYLYFCSSPKLWTSDVTQNDLYTLRKKVKYDLHRISYDLAKDTWGQLETILSAEDTGFSILQPRISPDGQWLLFLITGSGSWPVHHPDSDLCLMNLKAAQQTGKYQYQRLDINSNQSESWHSWSSNSRWIAFSSKRSYGTFTRTYFSYIDDNGKASKPLLLPQKDPVFYDSCIETYSVPELIAKPVQARKEKLGRIIRGSEKIEIEMPVTMASPKTGETSDIWQERE